MAQVLTSPFERANKLWGSHSSPAPRDAWEIPKKPVDDDYRPFQSPEAVNGFSLLAYRPSSLPLVQTGNNEGDALDEFATECSFSPQFSLAPLQWADVDGGAVSIVGTPPMQRTDMPLTHWLPPRDCSKERRYSLDGVERATARSRLELVARSASAPASYETLEVEELWKRLPSQPSFNPFANTPDNEGMFGFSP